MQKKVVCILLFLVIATACSKTIGLTPSDGDLPPEPVPPVQEPDAQVVRNLAGQASYPFEVGFSSPKDVYEEDPAKQQLFFTPSDVNYLSFQEDTFAFPVKVKHTDGVVYKYGYVYTKSKGWEKYEFPQTTFRSSNWIVEQAEVSLNLKRDEFDEGDNWVVAYSCRKIVGRWRCGMQEKDGAGGAWMLQRFIVRNTGTPQEPTELTNTCTDSDNGKVWGVRGTLTGTHVDPVTGTRYPGTDADACTNANTLQEWYCTQGTDPIGATELYTCPNGCENGACKAAAGAATPTTRVDFKLYYITSSAPYDTVPLTTLDCFTANNVVTCTKDYQGSSNYGAYYGELKPKENGWKVDKVEVLYQGTVKYTPTLTCTGIVGQQAPCIYSVPASEYTATADTYTTKVTMIAVAATSTTPTYAVCKVPLRDAPEARPAHLQGVDDTNAEAKCAELFVFGKTDGTAYSPLVVADLDTSLSKIENAGQSNEKLVCAIACAAGRSAITHCRDIAVTQTNLYYRPVVSGCS